MLLEKAFESIADMGNLYSAVVENIVAETNDFFSSICVAAGGI